MSEICGEKKVQAVSVFRKVLDAVGKTSAVFLTAAWGQLSSLIGSKGPESVVWTGLAVSEIAKALTGISDAIVSLVKGKKTQSAVHVLTILSAGAAAAGSLEVAYKMVSPFLGTGGLTAPFCFLIAYSAGALSKGIVAIKSQDAAQRKENLITCLCMIAEGSIGVVTGLIFGSAMGVAVGLGLNIFRTYVVEPIVSTGKGNVIKGMD